MFTSKFKQLLREIVLTIFLILFGILIIQLSIQFAPNTHSLHFAASLLAGGLISYGAIRILRRASIS